MKKYFLLSALIVLLFNCKKDKNQPSNLTTKDDTENLQPIKDLPTENIENKLITFLSTDYLKDDIDYLQEIDKKFQYHEVDLNNDNQNEVFIRFMSPYFCGTGGCTFLLLDSKLNIITKFSVTRAPIFVEKTKKNDWAILLVKDSGVFKELIYDNGTYPDNPSVLDPAPYDAPSGHALVLFDENFSNEKTIKF